MFYRNKNKTTEYRHYQDEFRDCVILEDGTDTPVWPFGVDPVAFDIEVGLSSKLADLDNVLKPVFDTYQSIYEEFNDKTVYEITAIKRLVSKGDEYIQVAVRRGTDGSEVSSADSTG